jgi:hypothetical protein
MCWNSKDARGSRQNDPTKNGAINVRPFLMVKTGLWKEETQKADVHNVRYERHDQGAEPKQPDFHHRGHCLISIAHQEN